MQNMNPYGDPSAGIRAGMMNQLQQSWTSSMANRGLNAPGQQAPGTMQAQMPQGSNGQLPATGLQAQMASLSQFYNQVQNAQVTGLTGSQKNIGFDPYHFQQKAQLANPVAQQGVGGMAPGQVNIQMLAKQLASRYGLPVGRGEIVDPQGNFLYTPEQLSAASGGQETMGMAAAKMNQISQAIANQQNKEQQRAGIAAASTGLGLVQSRGRGSAAAMQSGYYRDIADLYANQEHEAADFSFFIEEERFRMQQELQRRAEKLFKKQSRAAFITGIGLTVAGIATGNVGVSAQGAGMIAGGAGGTGWF